MIDSDSDLEVLEVVVPKRRSKRLSGIHENDIYEDELLDIDDGDGDIIGEGSDHLSSFRAGSKSNVLKKSKSRKCTNESSPSPSRALKNFRKTKSVPEEIFLEDDEDDISVATELVEDDDLDSLPSISPPSPPSQATAFDNADNGNIEMDYNDDDDDDGLGETYPVHQSSSGGTTTTTLSKSSSKSSLQDNVNFDELLQEAEYESLSDYLAKINKNKKSSEMSKKAVSNPSTSKSIPSFSSFASQSARPSASKNPSLTGHSLLETAEKKVTSYQVNRKSPSRMGKTKKKDKENAVVPSSSITSSASSSTAAIVQGKQKPPKDMIILQISENVLSDELAAKLIEKEIQYKIVDSPSIVNSIMFEHNVPYKMVEKDLQVHEKMLKEIDANILIVFHVEENLELFKNELDRVGDSSGGSGSSASERSKCLTEWIQDIQRKYPEKKITLLINGLEAYLRKIQRAVQKEYRERVLQGDNPDNSKRKRKGNTKQGIKLSRYEVQNALISTQLETHMNYRFYDNSSDLALLLTQYTKSVGEAPQKQEKMKSTDFDWYAVADAVGGIPVEEKGQGMRSLWLAQLQQFPKVGQESALAIARIYGSPKALYQAYRRCSSLEEGKNMLTNIQVTMGVGPLAKTRKLGPEASKKIYRFFTSTDGEREIDG